RPGPEHQRPGELAEAGRAPRRGDEGLHPQGGEGGEPGRRLPRRRDDGGGRQRQAPHRTQHRYHRDIGAPDHGRQDVLRQIGRPGRAGAGGTAAAQDRRVARRAAPRVVLAVLLAAAPAAVLAAPQGPPRNYLILPFENVAEDRSLDWLSTGLSLSFGE